MKFRFDTLKCVKLFKKHDFSEKQAEALASALKFTEIHNIYSREEVDSMLSETVERVFREERERRELATQAADKRLSLLEQQSIDNHRQVRNTIVTVGLALAGYLSALIHFTH